ncbi:RNA polymerase sigma factor sigK [Actinoplanes sp. SE50]|uniref:RNA polymerase sigma factor n=1 Tax=unclassified Actinoplanes TaxID=2626549 RepID=UPI00023EBBF2|nr:MULTISPECIES: sigma-70 family RNA polymerase sigma factor [unclassified Actinoplanes]AEV86233.1 RNA polymerase sigma factor sigK [Actinoplanes sp. SE50/110]ATO84631.1 RNA polymerase sigma factor sigK [Actinoplanes sp. SE50]SLM02041.1 RNA polymerase sigma factor SigM [Actinoplanes sp. SE50/110]
MQTVDDDIGKLFDRHSRAVYNHAFRLTGSWSLAEEITSQTFLTAWQRRTDIRLVDGSALPWLLVTAGNHARTEQRTVRRWRRRLLSSPAPETACDHADDVAGRLDDERRMREVLTAVRGLPRAEREAVALCLWSGVGYPEAAAVLGITETAVRSRVSRARSRLTRSLSPAPPSASPAPPPASPASPAPPPASPASPAPPPASPASPAPPPASPASPAPPPASAAAPPVLPAATLTGNHQTLTEGHR